VNSSRQDDVARACLYCGRVRTQALVQQGGRGSDLRDNKIIGYHNFFSLISLFFNE
jgi:hypothetical protein